MLGNFAYHNPTKLYFGEDALDRLRKTVFMTVLFPFSSSAEKLWWRTAV